MVLSGSGVTVVGESDSEGPVTEREREREKELKGEIESAI